jgi:hypothetical protein
LISDEDIVPNAQQASDQSQPLSKTVYEGDVFGNDTSANTYQGNRSEYSNQVKEQLQAKCCPKCGYPLRPGSEKCPNCKFQVSMPIIEGETGRSSEYNESKYDHNERRRTRLTSGNKQPNKMRGTINPYMMNMEIEPTFVLKPIKRVGERHDFDEQEYEGKEVLLNRENTDPENASITSREQATITYTDGRWYIEDKSEQKTTFVQAAKKIELHDGDVILLGNRLFEFHK